MGGLDTSAIQVAKHQAAPRKWILRIKPGPYHIRFAFRHLLFTIACE